MHEFIRFFQKTINFLLSTIFFVSLFTYFHLAYLWENNGRDFFGRTIEPAPEVFDWVFTAITPLGWRLNGHIVRHWSGPTGFVWDIVAVGGVIFVYGALSMIILRIVNPASGRHVPKLEEIAATDAGVKRQGRKGR